MSLRLDQDTSPEGTEIKMSGSLRIRPPGSPVIEIGMDDFAELVVYTLVNTDLTPDDPRLRLMERLRRIRVVEGYNGEHTRRLEVMGVPGENPGYEIPKPRGVA